MFALYTLANRNIGLDAYHLCTHVAKENEDLSFSRRLFLPLLAQNLVTFSTSVLINASVSRVSGPRH